MYDPDVARMKLTCRVSIMGVKRPEVTHYWLLLGPMSGCGVNVNDDVVETLTNVAIVWRGVWRGMRRR